VRHARNCGVRELPIPLERLPEEDEIDQSVADILRVIKPTSTVSADIYTYMCVVGCLIAVH